MHSRSIERREACFSCYMRVLYILTGTRHIRVRRGGPSPTRGKVAILVCVMGRLCCFGRYYSVFRNSSYRRPVVAIDPHPQVGGVLAGSPLVRIIGRLLFGCNSAASSGGEGKCTVIYLSIYVVTMPLCYIVPTSLRRLQITYFRSAIGLRAQFGLTSDK